MSIPSGRGGRRIGLPARCRDGRNGLPARCRDGRNRLPAGRAGAACATAHRVLSPVA